MKHGIGKVRNPNWPTNAKQTSLQISNSAPSDVAILVLIKQADKGEWVIGCPWMITLKKSFEAFIAFEDREGDGNLALLAQGQELDYKAWVTMRWMGVITVLSI